MSGLARASSLKAKQPNRLASKLNSRHRKASVVKNASSKKRKREVESVDSLPWKRMSSRYFSSEAFGEEGGMLEIDEVSDVEVVYEETDGGRVAKFRMLESKEGQSSASTLEKLNGVKDNNEVSVSTPSEIDEETEEEEETPFDTSKLPEWAHLSIKAVLLSALHSLSFIKPTPIQERAIPFALDGRDVIGIAETGSGKTLAYGLPILQHLYSQPIPKGKRPVKALILTPTRELALQVASHLSACTSPPVAQSTEEKDKGRLKKVPRVCVAAVVGGMSAQKQRRVLERGADILVATPGRLWDLIEESDELARDLSHLRFLVLDEADRMVEAGHFEEVDNILRMTARKDGKGAEEIDGIEFEDGLEPEPEETEDKVRGGADDGKMQTFVFSATMSRDLQVNLKKRRRPMPLQTKKGGAGKPQSTLDELLLRLDFRDPEPEIIDLSPKGGAVSTLKESMVECLAADKDLYLYYFLLRYPGRSLVFLSSVDGIRRLLPICTLLNLEAHPLHSHLQQRQRLKNLDRFRANPNAILLATDVAARGLDIPDIDHVIHYQVPRSADVYIHRNGRTARAAREGFSLLMCAPDEKKLVKALMTSLDRDRDGGAGNEAPEQMPIELSLLDKLKTRVQLAKKIDVAAHRTRKEKHEKNWLREAADAMEIELDSDLDDSDSEHPSKSKPRKQSQTSTQNLKSQLQHLLAQPLDSLRRHRFGFGPGFGVGLVGLEGDNINKREEYMLDVLKRKQGRARVTNKK